MDLNSIPENYTEPQKPNQNNADTNLIGLVKKINDNWKPISIGFSVLIGLFLYFSRGIIPDWIKENQQISKEIIDCNELDVISGIILLNGEIPVSASMKMTLIKKYTKKEESEGFKELNEGNFSFKLCKSSTDLVVFQTQVAGQSIIFENQYSPSTIPDTIFLTPQ